MASERDRPHASDDRANPCVCFCLGVRRRTLVEAIRAGAATLAALRDCTRAGTACATCRIDLLALLAEEARGE